MVLLLVLTLSFGCSSSDDRKIKVQLSPEDREILNLSVELQQKTALEVWPGFEKFRTSVVFVSADGQFLFNAAGDPPSEYKKIESQKVSWSKTDYRAYDWHGPNGNIVAPEEFERDYLANAFSSLQTDRHFPFSILFIDSLERFHMKEMKWTIDEWVSIFWHEVFHNFQDGLYAEKLISNTITDLNQLRKLEESEKFLDQIRVEQKLLMSALSNNYRATKRKIICEDFLGKRQQRYKKMPKKAVATEKFYEISEGTARYVEEMMSLAAGKLLASQTEQERYKLHRFSYFNKYATKNVESFYARLDSISPTKKYYYNTGFALALLLDQIEPEWKNSIFQKDGFLYGKIVSWCKSI